MKKLFAPILRRRNKGPSSSANILPAQKPSGAFKGSVKMFFEGLEAGLAGIGVPGVEAIAKVPLLIIRYCEVRMVRLCPV